MLATAELVHYDTAASASTAGTGFHRPVAPWRDGRTPVNVSGGLCPRAPDRCHGGPTYYEVATHLRGEAGDRQIPGSGRLTTCSVWLGLCVHILEARVRGTWPPRRPRPQQTRTQSGPGASIVAEREVVTDQGPDCRRPLRRAAWSAARCSTTRAGPAGCGRGRWPRRRRAVERVVGRSCVRRAIAAVSFVTQAVLGPVVMDHAPAWPPMVVPRLLRGEEVWCQGFAEPGAGIGPGSSGMRKHATATTGCQRREGWTSWDPGSRPCLLLGAPGRELRDRASRRPDGQNTPGMDMRR